MSAPNLLLILTDHWRKDSLGHLGHPVAETPHLDEMAANGISCTDAYTPCPSCIAARRSIMTGQVPDTHGMVGYRDGKPWEYEHTLAGSLARAGYQTINVGKTHFHPQRLSFGFEQNIIPEDYNEWITAETGLLRAFNSHGVHSNSWMARPSNLPEIQQQETWFTNEAMKCLEKRDPTRPFFMSLSFNGPHPPWTPPRYYYDLFMNKTIPDPLQSEWSDYHARDAVYPLAVNSWRGKLSPELNHRARAGYFAYLAYLDAQIGRFIEYLGRKGLDGDTFIIFSTDHGEMLGDHNLWRKTYAYEGSAGIPFIIRPPADWDLPRNSRLEELIGLEDIMPTMLAAAGVSIPKTVEGKNLLPYIKGEESSLRPYYHHEHSPCYTPETAYQCLTGRDWKFIWNPITGQEQLFNRAEDPYELEDCAQQKHYASTLKKWRLKMAKHLKDRPEGFSDGKKLIPNDYPVWRGE